MTEGNGAEGVVVVVLQTFNMEHNIWYKNIIEQLKETSLDVIVVTGGSEATEATEATGAAGDAEGAEGVVRLPNWNRDIRIIHMAENVYEYTSFLAIHRYQKSHSDLKGLKGLKGPVYFFLHDTCVLGPDFETRLRKSAEILSRDFDYAPLGINRKRAQAYKNKYKTKFNICFCSSAFMNHDTFERFATIPDKKTAVKVELGNSPLSLRNFENVVVDQNVIYQVKQDKGFECVNGSMRNHSYIENIDVHKYVSKAFYKK